MPAASPKGFEVSRRAVAGAWGSLPVAAAARASGRANSGGELVTRCREWLAGEAQVDRLNAEWAAIDSRIIGRRRAGQGSDPCSATSAERAELALLERKLAALSQRQAGRLDQLSKAEPASLADAFALMTVAAHVLQYEGEPPYKLVCNALAVVATQV